MRLFPLLLLGGAATWYFLRLRSLGANIKINFRNVKISGGQILRPNIELTLGLQNPTSAAANLSSIIGDLQYEGQTIANFSSFEKVQIQGNTETIIKVNAVPNLIAVYNVIKNVIINRQPGKVLILSGRANINNISVPFNSSFQF